MRFYRWSLAVVKTYRVTMHPNEKLLSSTSLRCCFKIIMLFKVFQLLRLFFSCADEGCVTKTSGLSHKKVFSLSVFNQALCACQTCMKRLRK